MGKLKLYAILCFILLSGCASTIVVQNCKEVEDSDVFVCKKL